MSIQLTTKSFTIEQYHKMIEAGIFTEDDRVELIRGEIIEMSPVGKLHAACVDFVSNFLCAALANKVIVRVQNPIILNDLSEPQPDITLVEFRTDFYRSGLPQAQDILLLIEVADTSINYDRDVKIPLYAENGILAVWLIDINAKLITVYRQPTPTGYKDVKILQQGDSLSILAFPEIKLTVNNIFG